MKYEKNNDDLISRSALLAKECCGRIAGNDVREAPAVEAEPVRHGMWILDPCSLYNDAIWVCSVCGNEWMLIDGDPHDNQMNYCSRCGARMDGGTDND